MVPQRGQSSVSNSAWWKLKIKKYKVAETFSHTEIALKPNGQQKWELTLQEPAIFLFTLFITVFFLLNFYFKNSDQLAKGL